MKDEYRNKYNELAARIIRAHANAKTDAAREALEYCLPILKPNNSQHNAQ